MGDDKRLAWRVLSKPVFNILWVLISNSDENEIHTSYKVLFKDHPSKNGDNDAFNDHIQGTG